MRFAKPSPPSGWLGDLHPQAIEHARHATNPLRGSGAASAAVASRGKARHSGRAWCQHARNRIVRQSLSAILVDRLSQPRLAADTQRCLQRFDSAADLKQTKPMSARSTPSPSPRVPPLSGTPLADVHDHRAMDQFHSARVCIAWRSPRLRCRRQDRPRTGAGPSPQASQWQDRFVTWCSQPAFDAADMAGAASWGSRPA